MNKESIIEELRKSSKEVSEASKTYIDILLKNKKIIKDIYEKSQLVMSKKEFSDIFEEAYRPTIDLTEKLNEMLYDN